MLFAGTCALVSVTAEIRPTPITLSALRRPRRPFFEQKLRMA